MLPSLPVLFSDISWLLFQLISLSNFQNIKQSLPLSLSHTSEKSSLSFDIQMRIRGSSSNPSSFCPPISTTSSSSLVSCSENYLLSDDEKTHCEGLDLLVKAAHHVAGNVLFDVPLIQRKAVSGGKKAVLREIEKEESEEKKDVEIEVVSKPERQKRQLSLPSKYHDSVLQPWKRQTRQRKTIEIERGSD